jgi:hypothetical protein
MQRPVALTLIAILVLFLPVWPFNSHWTYGPAIAIAFLLGVNLLVLLCDFFGDRMDHRKPSNRA